MCLCLPGVCRSGTVLWGPRLRHLLRGWVGLFSELFADGVSTPCTSDVTAAPYHLDFLCCTVLCSTQCKWDPMRCYGQISWTELGRKCITWDCNPKTQGNRKQLSMVALYPVWANAVFWQFPNGRSSAQALLWQVCTSTQLELSWDCLFSCLVTESQRVKGWRQKKVS